MAFRGSFDHTLDAKNRLTIPAKFRAAFAEGAVLSLQHDAPEQCLAIWRREDFDSFTEGALDGLHPMSREFSRIKRFYNANAHDTELDGAGRVMVPAHLLDKTGLDRDVVVNGAGNCLEVWGRAAWARESNELTATITEFTDKLGNPA